MRALLILATAFSLLACSYYKTQSRPESPDAMQTATKSLHDFQMKTLQGEDFDFASLKGKKVLIVNVASKCGFTPQYADLQELHEKHGDKVAVVGVPANDFGGQEPGTHQEIAEFCQLNYGVSFTMLEKVSVKGAEQHPLYQWLSSKEENGWNEQEPSWNFCKYLVDEEGALLEFYASAVNPLDEKIVSKL